MKKLYIKERIDRGFRRILCKAGLHTPFYKYGPEKFLTWAEIKAGGSCPPIQHLGWHCRLCDKPYKREVRAGGARPGFLKWLRTTVQPL